MDILFLGILFDKNDEKKILNNSKNGVLNSVNTFQWNLVDGLLENNIKNFKIINVLPVGSFPFKYKKVILKNKNWQYKNFLNYEIGGINIPGIKQFGRFVKIKKEINSWIKIKEESLEEKVIILYTPYLPFLKAVSRVPQNIKICLIVTDLPEFAVLGSFQNVFSKIIRKIMNKFIYYYINRIDCYVLLSEKMKDALKIGKKPYVVVEGIASNCKNRYKSDIGSKEKILLYTGTLHYKFGITNLLNAFSEIKDKNYYLWICGSGEAKRDIIEAAQNDKRIKYWGYVNKNDLKIIQKKASLLLNPRPNTGEYTKYSFPSKTIEYMLSGIPVLMYKLDGIPDEYDEFLYYFNSEDPLKMAQTILEVCSKKSSVLQEKGKKAQAFILNEKNAKIQTKKILKMFLGIDGFKNDL